MEIENKAAQQNRDGLASAINVSANTCKKKGSQVIRTKLLNSLATSSTASPCEHAELVEDNAKLLVPF